VPSNLLRFQHSGQTYFLTFGCYHRRQLLSEPAARQAFEEALERVRTRFGLFIYGYVVMPDHIHLLICEPANIILHEALKSLNQRVSRRLKAEAEQFWQKRYYDFNIRDEMQFKEKLRYIHRNPVQRGLCAHPQDWEWSSFRHYATGTEGRVEIESQWTAAKRERPPGNVPHSSQKKA
jgi:putative transposase